MQLCLLLRMRLGMLLGMLLRMLLGMLLRKLNGHQPNLHIKADSTLSLL